MPLLAIGYHSYCPALITLLEYAGRMSDVSQEPWAHVWCNDGWKQSRHEGARRDKAVAGESKKMAWWLRKKYVALIFVFKRFPSSHSYQNRSPNISPRSHILYSFFTQPSRLIAVHWPGIFSGGTCGITRKYFHPILSFWTFARDLILSQH